MSVHCYLARTKAERHIIVGPKSWAASIYSRMVEKFPHLPWPCAGRAVRVRFAGIPEPFFARLGASDMSIMDQVFRCGEYAAVSSLPVESTRQIIDLGSNAGFTLRLWKRLYPGARVIAVEPDESNYRTLLKNLDAIGGPEKAGVSPFRACVADKPGRVFLTGGANESGRVMSHAPGQGVEVEAVTMPQLLERAGFSGPIDLLKCDIEGAEQELFRDCGAWIGRVRNLIAETHPPYSAAALAADVARCGGRLRTVSIADLPNIPGYPGTLQLIHMSLD